MSNEELMLGEVTDEVRAFLESMGRTVLPVDPGALAQHIATKTLGRIRRQRTSIRHDPPAWSPLTTGIPPLRVRALREDLAWEHEVGERVVVGARMQSDFVKYLSTLPTRIKETDE